MFDIISANVEVSPQALNRGLKYFREQRVDLRLVGDEKIVAEVEGSDNSYSIEMELDSEKNILLGTGSCTCPAYWEYPGPCKHIIATALSAQDELKARFEATEAEGSALLTGDGRTNLRKAGLRRGNLREGSRAQSFGAEQHRKSDRAATDLLKAR
ncbi:MAG: SWIM zinc finger family protein, partial [Coriobacteriales bacterium]|nr:SWIM zinc finger family protein [Coriobacteriales bacterium]